MSIQAANTLRIKPESASAPAAEQGQAILNFLSEEGKVCFTPLEQTEKAYLAGTKYFRVHLALQS